MTVEQIEQIEQEDFSGEGLGDRFKLRRKIDGLGEAPSQLDYYAELLDARDEVVARLNAGGASNGEKDLAALRAGNVASWELGRILRDVNAERVRASAAEALIKVLEASLASSVN